jgi:hypothetical protein
LNKYRCADPATTIAIDGSVGVDDDDDSDDGDDDDDNDILQCEIETIARSVNNVKNQRLIEGCIVFSRP